MADQLDDDAVIRQLLDAARQGVESTDLRRAGFLDSVLLEIARAGAPASVAGSEITRAQIRLVASEHIDDLRSAEFRHHLAIELIRRGSVLDLQMIRSAPVWRTYLALHTGFTSIVDSGLRAEVQQLIADADERFVDSVAGVYASYGKLLGYRVRADMPRDLVVLGHLASAMMRGLAVMSLADPELAEMRHTGAPYGAVDTTDWSLAGLGIGALVDAWFEPDPDIVWDDERIEHVRAVLDEQLADQPAGRVTDD